MSELSEEYFRKAYECQRSGRFEDAIDFYQKSIEVCPTAEAHTFLGWTYSFQNRYLEAIAECQKAIEVDPEFGNPYNDIGAYLIELGRWEEAIPWLQKATRAARYEPRHFPHFNLARIYSWRYEYGPAREHLSRAIQLEPRYGIARRELAKLIARLN
jgi:tetratricopeptide (TPR) repeat protein